MAGVDDEQRKLLNKQLLAAARLEDGPVEDLLTGPEYRDPVDEDRFLFDVNCTDSLGNTPLHLAVLCESVDNVDHLIEADGCDVDPQNKAGDTPLHLAVQIADQMTRGAIVFALVEIAGATDSIRLVNKAGQTPNALARIYCPEDIEVITLTRPPAREVSNFLSADDIASDGEDTDSDP